MSNDPQPTLRALLGRRELGLRLDSAEDALRPDALDAPLRWVHSSDLADPTPFLADDLLLLTTGTQFAVDAEPDDYRAYVTRLRSRGVQGLGFGTEVVRDGIPPALAEACRDAGMPLFEVPYRTPFIALARANAEAVAAQAYARRTWALSAQRAISLAALRPDGLGATVAELGRQLGAWTGLFDATGALAREHPSGGLDPDVRVELTAEVGAVLRRGARAGSSVEIGGERFTLQTLGRGGHLRGAIVIAGGELDLEGRGVVTSVIAMAGLALEQNVGLNRARDLLRAGLVHSLLTDDPSLARRVARELWGALPSAPIVVAVATVAPARADAAADWLELRRTDRSVFHGRGAAGLVIAVSAEDHDLLDEFATLFGATIGASQTSAYTAFAHAHAQAVTARNRRGTIGHVARFDDLAGEGVLAQLAGPDARAVAEAHLAPLRTHDEAHGTVLLSTVRVWLEHDARIDAAARSLGIHRHTVRARVAQAQTLLRVDLSAFPARAELWAALVSTA
ncbi:helix-turn-helix domain-containing protein [Microbacterium memoriense]|uniref:PucR family transcriptional regulator n=1 Tax=Microbacterium memoriense TaxID=2978350 RepID=A0ABT2PCL3_9MICO|nr:PucR family transcriptional regulator [Microbacterium memoriense]MCT9002185.1 PucR family transcriptional regulator [Microbacterium memoriense]